MPKINDSSTLKEVKDELRENWHDGLNCPACTQFVKLYKRKITSSMAYALILFDKYIEKNPDKEYIHLGNYLNTLEIPGPVRNTGDISKLKYWDLIEEMPAERADGSRHAGFWKITEVGKQFARNEVSVMSHAKVFNSKCYGLEGDLISIQDALGSRFNYKELMES